MSIRLGSLFATVFCGSILALSSICACAQHLESSARAKLTAAATKMEDSCGTEIKQFCSTVTPGEGRMVFCMEAHEDKLSPKCTAAMIDAAKDINAFSDMLKTATEMCRGDVKKACGQTQIGHGRLLQCLMANKASVSSNCSDAVQKIADFVAK